MMALGFDAAMRGEGFVVRGPLSGFYDWRRPETFAPALRKALGALPDGAVIMCHPGRVDDTLRSRDGLLDARPVELETLASDRLAEELGQAGAAIARSVRLQPGLAGPAGGA
jgi:predicted glycoside hydrolase/deacetylase ChbG (UPF0249 family)